jgi:hypothetical protein
MQDIDQLKQIDKVKPSDQKIEAELESVGIVILNDMGNTFTPILDFELSDLKLRVNKNILFTTVLLEVPLRMNYYNPRASRWEPVIEKCAFTIDQYINNFKGLGANILTIEQNTTLYKALNINASTMFFQTVFRTLYLVKKMAEPLLKKDESQIKSSVIEEEKKEGERRESQIEQIEDEAFAQVSPYMVRNHTGYKITCEPQLIQGLSKAKNQL